MRFDAPSLASAWLSVAQASGTDKDSSELDRTVAIEEYYNGIRLVATDRFVLLTAWVPDLHTSNVAEPHLHEVPDRTVIASDADGRGKGLLGYILKIAKRDELDAQPEGTLEVRVDFDVRIPAGENEDQPLEGLEPKYVLLTVPDVERVYLRTVEATYPEWRSLILDHASQSTEAIALHLERLHRLAPLRKWNLGPVVWTFGGSERAALIDLIESDPHVSGIVMPARWVLAGEEPTDDVDDAQTSIVDDRVECPEKDCDYWVDGSEDGDAALSDVVHHMSSRHGVNDSDTALRAIHGLPAKKSNVLDLRTVSGVITVSDLEGS